MVSISFVPKERVWTRSGAEQDAVEYRQVEIEPPKRQNQFFGLNFRSDGRREAYLVPIDASRRDLSIYKH